MPPKRKPPTEQELKQQFEQWKTTEQYMQWEKCRQMLLELVKDPRGLTETTHDLTGDWYKYIDEVWKLFGMMKVKNPQIKKLEQEKVRSIFFGRHDDDDIIHYVDGIHSGVSKDAGQRCYHMRHKFIGVYKLVQELNEFEPSNYQQKRKEIVGFMKEFIKFFAAHIKQKLGHAEIYDGRLFDVIRPLQNLIEKNMEYRLFVLKYQNDYDQEIVHFQLQELEKKYSEYLQENIRIISKECRDENLKPVESPLNCMPPVEQIFYQLHYRFEETNLIEKLYLDPLHDCFLRLQKELCRLQFKGINYWKTPMWMNYQLVACIQNLLNAELIAKAIMGNQLQREELNFVYSVLRIMKEADEKVFENLIKEDENALNKACPLLIIFQMVQHQRRWKDRKIEIQKKRALEKEALSVLSELRAQQEDKSPLKEHKKTMELRDSILLSMSPPKPPPPPPAPAKKTPAKATTTDKKKSKSPSKTAPAASPDQKGATLTSTMPSTSMEINLHPTERLYKLETIRLPGKDLTEEEKEFGRYFILEDFINDEHKLLLEDAVELIRHVNPAVQQDIQDYYIKEGITPMKKRGVKDDKDLKQAIKYLDQKNLEENANDQVNQIRPPEMWNYPKIIQESHQFRTIADPKASYIDGRIDLLHQIIEDTSKHLLTYNAVPWARLVQRIINCFNGIYNPDPETELIIEEIQKYG